MTSVANPACGIWRRNPSRTRFHASDACRSSVAAIAIPAGLPGKRTGTSMSARRRNYAAARRGVGAHRAVAIDPGLRAYMIRVYNYMAMRVALTGVAAWLTFNAAVTETAGRLALTPFGQAIYSGPAVIVLFLATLG